METGVLSVADGCLRHVMQEIALESVVEGMLCSVVAGKVVRDCMDRVDIEVRGRALRRAERWRDQEAARILGTVMEGEIRRGVRWAYGVERETRDIMEAIINGIVREDVCELYMEEYIV
jgi:hypothetical protein